MCLKHSRLRRAAGLFLLVAACAASTCGQEPTLRRAGFVGVAVVAVPDEARQRLHLSGGVLVQRLVEGGTAQAAGLVPNDIITQVNDHKVEGVDDFTQAARALRAGEEATLIGFRDGQPLTKRVVVKPRPPEPGGDADVLYEAVRVGDSLRRTILTVPKQAGRHPAVLYIDGIGCLSQDTLDAGTSVSKLLHGLTRAGYVTMRVEKSGVGDSEGAPCASPAADMQAEVRGYVEGLRALKRYGFVEASQVYLLGLSIGGVEAPLIAEQAPVQGIVVVNTVGKSFIDYLQETRRRQMLLSHTPYDELERRLSLNEVCNHRMLIARESFDEVVKSDPACRDFITYPAPYTFMQQWAALNLAEHWKRVESPVLIVNGLSDFIATVSDGPYLADIINSFHPGHATLKAIPGMDHYLTRAASMEASMARTDGERGEFVPDVLEAIKDWLHQLPASKHDGSAQ